MPDYVAKDMEQDEAITQLWKHVRALEAITQSQTRSLEAIAAALDRIDPPPAFKWWRRK